MFRSLQSSFQRSIRTTLFRAISVQAVRPPVRPSVHFILYVNQSRQSVRSSVLFVRLSNPSIPYVRLIRPSIPSVRPSIPPVRPSHPAVRPSHPSHRPVRPYVPSIFCRSIPSRIKRLKCMFIVHLFARPFVRYFTRPSVHPLLCQTIRPYGLSSSSSVSDHPSVRSSVLPSIRQTIRSSVPPFVRPSVLPSLRQTIRRSVRRSAGCFPRTVGLVTGHPSFIKPSLSRPCADCRPAGLARPSAASLALVSGQPALCRPPLSCYLRRSVH